jgi:hypothetical protein
MKHKLLYVAVLSLALLLAATAVAAAQAPDEPASFDNASLTGTYAVTQIDSNVAVIGLCDFDGAGALKCNATINAPGQNNDRIVFPASNTGTYTLTAAGVGLAQEVETGPDGSKAKAFDLFAVTDAKAVGHNLLATQIDSSSPNGNGSTSHAVFKRLPDMDSVEGGFSNASLNGVYALSSPIGPGEAGICHMDGEGNFTCDFSAAHTDEKGEAQTASASISGVYTVTSDGMGSIHYVITLPDGNTIEGNDDFVISTAESDGPFVIATEITDINRDSSDDQGTLNVNILRRLPDLADTGAISETGSMSDATSRQ